VAGWLWRRWGFRGLVMEARSKAELFFAEADKERLRAAVRDVESRTVGEVSPW